MRAVRSSMWAGAIALLALGAPATRAQVMPGGRAPEIDLPMLTGGRVKLSELRGKPVVVTFWGTYCPPCRLEFPELVRAQQRHASAGLFVLGVNGRDQEFSTNDVQKFVDELSVSFSIALDKRGKSRTDYLIVGLPTTVFIDSGGIIRSIHRGPIDRTELEVKLASILPAH